MAKRRYTKKGSKIQPAVQTLTFAVPVGTSYIDLSQVASLVNRRFYRQGINWAVGGFKFIGTASAGVIQISKLPNTWVMSNAWEKSFRAWQQMIKNATDESGAESIKGKFLDFKIYADATHHGAGFDANLLPYAGYNAPAPGNQFVKGQWQPAIITLPRDSTSSNLTDDFSLIAVGANDSGVGPDGRNSKSVIQGYADSRALPYSEDPNVPADASENWMVRLFAGASEQDQDVIDNLEIVGDLAPYPFEGDGTNLDTMYPGGETNVPYLQTHDYEFVTGTTVGGTTRLKGGNFPCGLIRIDFVGDNAVNMQIDLVPGNHRGYLCEPMTEM